MYGKDPNTEQEVPGWAIEDVNARLDIVFHDPTFGNVAVDVSVVNTDLPCRKALSAIQRREKAKHKRYPFRGLFAFVVDVRGRWGKQARDLVQRVGAALPQDERVEASAQCRAIVSRVLQTSVANQIITSANF